MAIEKTSFPSIPSSHLLGSHLRRLEMRALPAEDLGKHRAQLKGLEAMGEMGEAYRKMVV